MEMGCYSRKLNRAVDTTGQFHRGSCVITSPLGWARSIAFSMSVCLFVRSKTTCVNFTKFSVRATCGRGSVLRRQQCSMLYTSGFVDDATFSHNTGRAYVVYGDAYGQEMSVSGRQRREGRSFNASAPPLFALSAAD